jgi:hypothetical protein
MRTTESPEKQIPMLSGCHGCEEHNRLLDEFGKAAREVIRLHEQQFRALVKGDEDLTRLDYSIQSANEAKRLKKSDYLRHVESHGCSKG